VVLPVDRSSRRTGTSPRASIPPVTDERVNSRRWGRGEREGGRGGEGWVSLLAHLSHPLSVVKLQSPFPPPSLPPSLRTLMLSMPRA